MSSIKERVVTPEDLSNDFVEILKVPVDTKGSVMYIGSLSADDFVEWQEAKDVSDLEAKKSAGAQLMMRSLVKGPDKNPDGTDLTPEQHKAASVRIGTPANVAAFRKMKVASSERLLKAILKLNYINQKDEVAAKNS
jgi:hypothetical protein